MDYHLVDGRPALYRADSHESVELATCLLLSEPLLQLFMDLPRRPRSERVTLRAGLHTGETAVLFDDDRGVVHEIVGGHRFRITDRAFFQTNTAGAEELVRLVGEVLTPTNDEVLVDGYAGGGLFAATVGASCRQVFAVESEPTALSDLAHNSGATIVDARYEGSRAHLPRKWDLAVVDPPRAGLGADGVAVVVAGSPRAIAYVSCDAASFARDAGLLATAGYRLQSAQPVDMFPQTFHVEIVGSFTR
jgi:23S rRNA (uracil1939-C5)-methyltransferase